MCERTIVSYSYEQELLLIKKREIRRAVPEGNDRILNSNTEGHIGEADLDKLVGHNG